MCGHVPCEPFAMLQFRHSTVYPSFGQPLRFRSTNCACALLPTLRRCSAPSPCVCSSERKCGISTPQGGHAHFPPYARIISSFKLHRYGFAALRTLNRVSGLLMRFGRAGRLTLTRPIPIVAGMGFEPTMTGLWGQPASRLAAPRVKTQSFSRPKRLQLQSTQQKSILC